MNGWMFQESPDTLVLTLRGVVLGSPILQVERDEQGGWHFLDDREFFSGTELLLTPLGRIVVLDATVSAVAGMRRGCRARRINALTAWNEEPAAVSTTESTRAILNEMKRIAVAMPPHLPGVVEMLREDRER